jgi:AraC-like DNA-binding protein
MVARVHRLPPPLGGFVDCFWYFDHYLAPHPRERALPTGTVELVVSLRQQRVQVFRDEADQDGLQFQGAVVCGPHSGYFVLDTSQPASVVGVHFRPGGAAPFLGAPAGEYTNRHLALDDVWGASQARELHDRLLAAASPEAMFAILERALLARLRRPFLPHPAVAYTLRQLSTAPALSHIGRVQEETGYAAKRFIELFRDAVGLTPKVYCRIERFQKVIERLAGRRKVEWAEVALDGGYYDQSHLNREFRSFCGVTPTEYHPLDGRPNHTPLDS